MEKQADYGERERIICPVMSRPHPEIAEAIQPVYCMGERCGMHPLCSQKIREGTVAVKNATPAPGL